ncbi:MAG TPA: CrcB family protein [Pseudoclavibacter sp.]|nr:CrcB family protein [Pseudoclavibacter sp.]
MGTFLAIILAGGLGSVLRFITDGWVSSRVHLGLPVGTILINIVGSVLLGVVTGLAAQHVEFAELKTVIGTGLAGGFTTFSTASVEGANLLGAPHQTARSSLRAAVHAGIMLLLGVAGGAAGMWAGALI